MTSNSKYPEDWLSVDLPGGLTFYNKYSIKLPKMKQRFENSKQINKEDILVGESIENLVDSIKENGYIFDKKEQEDGIINLLCKAIESSSVTDWGLTLAYIKTLETLVSEIYRIENPKINYF